MSDSLHFSKILDHVRQLRKTRGSNESFRVKRLFPAEEQGRLYGGFRHVEATLVAEIEDCPVVFPFQSSPLNSATSVTIFY
jgi:hypothetical protein